MAMGIATEPTATTIKINQPNPFISFFAEHFIP